MIPSTWRNQRDRAASRSRKGGVDSVLADLLDVAAAIHYESASWPETAAVDLYLAAWQIQTVAIRYARHEITKDDARIWIDVGTEYVEKARMQRRKHVQR